MIEVAYENLKLSTRESWRFLGRSRFRARILDQPRERLKREVSLARLIGGQGHKLTSQGKDLACRWHDGDDTPPYIVSPKTNLWHCFGCDAGGTVIYWVMRSHKVPFRHAGSYGAGYVVGRYSNVVLTDPLANG